MAAVLFQPNCVVQKSAIHRAPKIYFGRLVASRVAIRGVFRGAHGAMAPPWVASIV